MGNCLRCRCGTIEDTEDVTGDDVLSTERVRDNDPIMYLAPNAPRPMSQLTEEEQVKIATRMGMIAALPLFKLDEENQEKLSECVICMGEYEAGEELRYLPCLHTYHRACIDDWLMRSLTCPSCLEELRPATPHGTRSADSIPTGDRPALFNTAPQASSAPAEIRMEPPVSVTMVAPDSSYCGDSLSPVTMTSSNMNNNRSGGDGLNGAVVPSTSRDTAPAAMRSRGLHRRTRSNGHVHRRPDVSRAERRRRRGNSTSDLAALPSGGASPTPPNLSQPRPPTGFRGTGNLAGDSH